MLGASTNHHSTTWLVSPVAMLAGSTNAMVVFLVAMVGVLTNHRF
jgi:hypothetical protein